MGPTGVPGSLFVSFVSKFNGTKITARRATATYHCARIAEQKEPPPGAKPKPFVYPKEPIIDQLMEFWS